MRVVIVFANFDMGIKEKALYSMRYKVFCEFLKVRKYADLFEF